MNVTALKGQCDTTEENIKGQCYTLQAKITSLQAQHCALESWFPVPPVDGTIYDFQNHMNERTVWYSPPFYTHQRGYKLCLRVDANGNCDGEGTHVSIYAYLMQGEFDDHLKWPFQGHVVIQLHNQLEDKHHCRYTIPFSETTGIKVIGRVPLQWGVREGLPD